MYSILQGLRVIEASAFVAAPLGGMTLSQLGADVIRFDPISGGMDAKRWPITDSGKSLYWAGLNKGKRSLSIDTRKPEGQEIIRALITAPGDGNGIFTTNFPAAKGWMSHEVATLARQASGRWHMMWLTYLDPYGPARGTDLAIYPIARHHLHRGWEKMPNRGYVLLAIHRSRLSPLI